MDSYSSNTTKPIFRGTQVVWYIVGLLEVFLVFRLVLKMLAANAAAGFSSFIYGVTYIFVAPFNAVFGITQVQGSILEWTTLLAMLVYYLVAWAIIKLLVMSKTVSTPEAAAKLSKAEA